MSVAGKDRVRVVVGMHHYGSLNGACPCWFAKRGQELSRTADITSEQNRLLVDINHALAAIDYIAIYLRYLSFPRGCARLRTVWPASVAGVFGLLSHCVETKRSVDASRVDGSAHVPQTGLRLSLLLTSLRHPPQWHRPFTIRTDNDRLRCCPPILKSDVTSALGTRNPACCAA